MLRCCAWNFSLACCRLGNCRFEMTLFRVALPYSSHRTPMGWRFWTLVLVAVCAVAQTPPPSTKYMPPAPEQPIPYSHKKHLALGLECKNCHEMVDPGNNMELPATDKCTTCHRSVKADSSMIQKLAQFQKDGKPVPWV